MGGGGRCQSWGRCTMYPSASAQSPPNLGNETEMEVGMGGEKQLQGVMTKNTGSGTRTQAQLCHFCCMTLGKHPWREQTVTLFKSRASN